MRLTGTYDGTNICIYVNGKLEATTKQSGTIKAPTNNTVMAIGTNPNGSQGETEWANMKVYSAKVYNKALSANAITQWDVSEAQDSSILANYETASSGALKVYISSSSSIYANADSRYLFSYIGYASKCTATTAISNLSSLYTSNVTNMRKMFHWTGNAAMTSLDLGNNFDTTNVTDMGYMFQHCGENKMTSLKLGSKFNTSKVTNMDGTFAETGIHAMTSFSLGSNFDTSNVTTMRWMFSGFATPISSLSLGSKFNTSKVTDMFGMFNATGKNNMKTLDLGSNFDTSNVKDMGYMFNSCGYSSMTSLNLGDKFNTSNVTNMINMFCNTGYTAMTTLTLGDKFNTSKVTDMYQMFYNTGYTAMTKLDLGSAFTKIPSGSIAASNQGGFSIPAHTANENFVTGCGKSNSTNDACSIYVTGDIYKDQHTFKLSSSSSSTVAYSRGVLIYDVTAPTWAGDFANDSYSSSTKTLTFTIRGNDETALDTDASTLSTSNATVKVNGTAVRTSDLTITKKKISGDKKYIDFQIAIKNFTSGTIEISINAGALVDRVGNKSAAKTLTFYEDYTKPKWANSDETYSTSAKTFSLNLVGSDETKLNDSSSTLSVGTGGNLTVKVGGTAVSSSNLTLGSTSLSTDGKTKTFPLTIKNYTGGKIDISIDADALVDMRHNKSNACTISFTPDVTAPIWANDVSDKSWSTSAKTYSFKVIGSDDKALKNSASVLSTSNVTVKVGGTAVSSSNLTIGYGTLSSDSTTKTFPITIKNYIGGKIEMTIKAGALVDVSPYVDGGNKSAEKTYTIATDETKPEWAGDVSNKEYSASAKTYSLNLVGTDDKYLNDSSSTLVTSGTSKNITVKVKGSTVDASYLTVGSGSLSPDGTTKTFPLTIKNYTGGSISITISARALVDTYGNTSVAKTYSFTPDTTAPTWAADISNGQFSLSAKTYKFNVVGSDETSLNASSSTLTKGTSGNISITVNGTTTTNYTIGTATTSGNTKTFPITLNNFTGGNVKITISAGALIDTAKNTSVEKIYEFWVDGERPVWADNIINGTYDADAKTYTLQFKGTDNSALASTTLSSSNVSITATDKNGNTTSLNNLSFGSVTTSSDSKTKTFPLTINNFPGGDIKITISSGALKDTTGNTSEQKIYEFSVDGVSPTWADSISKGQYSESANTYSFEISGSDDVGLNNSSSKLTSGSTGNITITVDGSSANFTLGSTSLSSDGKTKTFPITINNFYGGDLELKIKSCKL